MTLEPERLLEASEIVARVFAGAVSERWVRTHCPGVRLSPRKILCTCMTRVGIEPNGLRIKRSLPQRDVSDRNAQIAVNAGR